MSDILDVMNIKSFPSKKEREAQRNEAQQQQQHNMFEVRQTHPSDDYASANKRRKFSAMNRELYNLIGSNVPPIAIDTISATGSGKKFKDKLVSTKKHIPWRNLGFQNSARKDGLILHHWTKSATVKQEEEKKTPDVEIIGSETKEDEGKGKEDTNKKEIVGDEEKIELDSNEYRYAKYNTKLEIPTFTGEEYEEFIKAEEEKKKKELEIKNSKEKAKLEKRSVTKEATDSEAKMELPLKNTEINKANESNDTPESEIKGTETKAAIIEESVAPSESEKKEDDNDEKNEMKEKNDNIENGKEELNKERLWTYEETEFLFELCSSFDMRWAVIFDRYQDKYSDRSIEDLKVQMYTLSAYLLEKRGNPNDSALIKALRSFNKEKELERKYYLTKLIHRAPTEIAEEESLVIEARKFELAAKKMLLERAQLLQLLDSPQSSASVQQYLTSQGLTKLYNSLMAADKSKKRKAEVPVAPLLGPNAIPHTQHIQMSTSSNNGSGSSHNNNNNNNNNNHSSNGNKRRSNVNTSSISNNNSNKNVNINNNNTKNNNNNNNNNNNEDNNNDVKAPSKLNEVQQLLKKSLNPEELEVYGIEIHNDRIQPGVHVRSQKIASFKPSVQAKVHEILGQLGLSEKPTMPTGPVSKKFDELLNKIAHLVDLKKQSDKLVAEIDLIKRQKGIS